MARQTYPLIEHVVMDGGSTDGTVAVLEEHARSGLRWTSEPDRGQSYALNKAFQMSRGEIVGWLNSDDAYFGATAVADAVAAFRLDPRINVVYGHAVLVNGDGLVLQVIWAPSFSRRLLRLHDYVIQPTAFIRRTALGEVMVDESFDYAMDYELWLRLARLGRFHRLDSIIAIDRHHLGRKSYTMADLGQSDHLRLEERYRVAGGASGAVGRKLWKIGARFAGIRLVRDATENAVVFDATRDGRLPLYVRQIAVRRASMAAGS